MARKIIKCSECGKECLPRRHALGMCSTHYQIHKRRTDLQFFLNEKYTAMVKRTKYAADPRHFGLSVCSRDEFMEFCKDNQDLMELWNNWKDSGYSLKDCPSIDRIDLKEGYELHNLQWISQSRNSGKDKEVPVRAFKDGILIGEFTSKNEAGRVLGVHPSNIYKVYSGRRKSTGGYTFEKVE